MIAAVSIMKRRPDISNEQFRRHWLHPHGTMTAELPGVGRYVQSHCIEHATNNALARELDLGGFPVLWFKSYEDRRIAYTSPRIAECNVDSEQFVGAVTRLVTEPREVLVPQPGSKPRRVFVLLTGKPDKTWADAAQARLTALDGVAGYIRHDILEQAAAPASRIPELKLPVAGLAEVAFADDAALMRAASVLAGSGAESARTAVMAVEDYVLRA